MSNKFYINFKSPELDFGFTIADQLLDKKFIEGIYRNHHIRIETIKNVAIRISVDINEPEQKSAHSGSEKALTSVQFQRVKKKIIGLLKPRQTNYYQLEPLKVVTSVKRRQVVYEHKNHFNISGKVFLMDFVHSELFFLPEIIIDAAEGYPQVVALGSKAIVPLIKIGLDKANPYHPLASSLLNDIGFDGQKRLGHHPETFLCMRCLVYCHKYQIIFNQQEVTYHGCRTCGRNRDVAIWQGKIIAVLDKHMKKIQKSDVLRGNWLVYRTAFDFDEVEIIEASDEDVERFAVQIGNDTDIIRRPRYKKMNCMVSADCHLSSNSMRILAKTFGNVEEITSKQCK